MREWIDVQRTMRMWLRYVIVHFLSLMRHRRRRVKIKCHLQVRHGGGMSTKLIQGMWWRRLQRWRIFRLTGSRVRMRRMRERRGHSISIEEGFGGMTNRRHRYWLAVVPLVLRLLILGLALLESTGCSWCWCRPRRRRRSGEE